MKVEFDRIRREFLPDGTDTYVEVVVTSGEPTLQAVSAAVDAANEPEQDRYPDDPGASEVIGPWPVPGAANRFTIQVRPPLDIDVLQDWFTRFAELLGTAGLDGRIGLPKQIMWPYEVINDLPRDQLHAFMAFPLRNPDPFSGARWWNSPADATQVAADLTPLGATPTTNSFMVTAVARPVRPEDLPEAVAAHVPRQTGLNVWHVRRDPPRAVTYKFSADGSLFRLLHDDAMTWQQQVADHLHVLRTAGSALELGFIRRLASLPNGGTSSDAVVPPFHTRTSPSTPIERIGRCFAPRCPTPTGCRSSPTPTWTGPTTCRPGPSTASAADDTSSPRRTWPPGTPTPPSTPTCSPRPAGTSAA